MLNRALLSDQINASGSHCNIAWFMLKIIRFIMLNGNENVHPIMFVYNCCVVLGQGG